MEADEEERQMKQAGGYVEDEEAKEEGEQQLAQAVKPKEVVGVMPKPLQDRKLQEAMIGRGLLAPRIS